MRILWHGIGPEHNTGYGNQTRTMVPRLAALGHEVVLAVMGRKGIDDKIGTAHPGAEERLRTGEWQGIRVIGPGLTEFGLPMPLEIRAAFAGHDPDLIIVLKDPFVLNPVSYRRYNTAAWCAIDCDPMSLPDRQFFASSGAAPLAMSIHGLKSMQAAGLEGSYIPHGIEMDVWTPGGQAAARDLLELPGDYFIAGINATNVGPRKAWGEQFTAFARFHAKHPRSLLLVHSTKEHPEGISLEDLAVAKGIRHVVKFADNMNQEPAALVNWYRSLDVLINATYGEGFGLPVLEALACGIPVIVTDCSAMSEKVVNGCGWRVACQSWWNPHLAADWHIPSIPGITAALGKAWRKSHASPDVIRGTVAGFDADLITTECWKPILEELTGP